MPKTTNPLLKKSGPSTNAILSIVVVVAAVLIIGGVLLFTAGKGDNAAGGQPPAPGQDMSQVVSKPDSHKLTEAPDAKVTVTEFLDFQCPSCFQYYNGVTKNIEQEYKGRINFVNRMYPLTNAHPLAMEAAKSAEAAAMQGKYKEMYHAIFDNYRAWAVSPDGQQVSDDTGRANQMFTQYAQQIGLDVNKFKQDKESKAVSDRIATDQADAEKAGISGTPSFFINGQKWEPSGKSTGEIAQQLRQRIDQELAR